MQLPLPPLKLMVQSRRGVAHMLEAQAHLLAVAIPRFILIEEPLLFLHTMAPLRAAKAVAFE
jgi:hypothetical protein